jgi:RHS repeat-associated protein
MTHIGTSTTPLMLGYDSSDRSWGYEQINDSTGNGTGLYYDRDVQGRITGRYKSNIVNWDWQDAGSWHYHYTASGDTPDYVRDSNWDIIEKTLQLPGGVNLTIKPQESQANDQKQYSLPNIHSDTLLTTNAAGTNTSTGNGPASAFTYDPFGNVLQGSVLPSNTAGGSYGWVGQHQKITESTFTLTPISMGARIYLPGIGRFTQVDPVEGGVENSYVYPGDPVNEQDLSGMCPMCAVIPVAGWLAVRAAPVVVKGLTVVVESYGGTGGSWKMAGKGARDLGQQLALKEALSYGGKRVNLRGGVKDPKFINNWQKKSHTHKGKDGRVIRIHWMENIKSGKKKQIKIKYDSRYNKKGR